MEASRAMHLLTSAWRGSRPPGATPCETQTNVSHSHSLHIFGLIA